MLCGNFAKVTNSYVKYYEICCFSFLLFISSKTTIINLSNIIFSPQICTSYKILNYNTGNGIS